MAFKKFIWKHICT